MSKLQVANTIWQQLNAGRERRIRVMSWGTKSLVGSDEGYGFLMFSVSGMKFKGKVKVELNGMDYYDVRFYKRDSKEPLGYKEVKTLNDVDCESLNEMIDDYIERQNEYSF
jgi:hypothetical protein